MIREEVALTQNRLKELLEYDPSTGIFKWRNFGPGVRYNREAGTLTNKGYVVIGIDNERYLANRLAFLYMTGSWPEHEAEHEDRNPANNTWINLRDATHAENLSNTTIRNDNTSGVKGVTWDKQKNKWKVQVGPAGKRVSKHFVALEDAKAFYAAKAEEIFGQFSAHAFSE